MSYVAREPTIRIVIAVNFLIVIVAMPYTQLLPGFVQAVLHKGAFEQGTLQSVHGLGAVGGALFLASAAARGHGKASIICGALLGVSIRAFAISTNFWVTLPIMVLLQTYAAEEFRGRVMSVWFMQFGLVQLGTFIVGLLSEWIGPQLAVGGMAALLVVAMGLVALFVPRMRALQ